MFFFGGFFLFFVLFSRPLSLVPSTSIYFLSKPSINRKYSKRLAYQCPTGSQDTQTPRPPPPPRRSIRPVLFPGEKNAARAGVEILDSLAHLEGETAHVQVRAFQQALLLQNPAQVLDGRGVLLFHHLLIHKIHKVAFYQHVHFIPLVGTTKDRHILIGSW